MQEHSNSRKSIYVLSLRTQLSLAINALSKDFSNPLWLSRADLLQYDSVQLADLSVSCNLTAFTINGVGSSKCLVSVKNTSTGIIIYNM